MSFMKSRARVGALLSSVISLIAATGCVVPEDSGPGSYPTPVDIRAAIAEVEAVDADLGSVQAGTDRSLRSACRDLDWRLGVLAELEDAGRLYLEHGEAGALDIFPAEEIRATLSAASEFREGLTRLCDPELGPEPRSGGARRGLSYQIRSARTSAEALLGRLRSAEDFAEEAEEAGRAHAAIEAMNRAPRATGGRHADDRRGRRERQQPSNSDPSGFKAKVRSAYGL